MVNFRGWDCGRSKDYDVEEVEDGIFVFFNFLFNILFDTKVKNRVV